MSKARDSTLLYLGDGPCSMIKTAHTGMDVEQIVDNILAASDAVAQRIPGKWQNVQGEQLALLLVSLLFARLTHAFACGSVPHQNP